jgi:glycerate dehydrogenase
MTKPRALFLDKASLYPDDLDFTNLSRVAEWQWFDNAKFDDIKENLHQAEIIVTNKVQIDEEILKECERLKLICVAATGVNNVDIAAAKQQGITICNVRAYATSSVVQHVFSLILSLNRHLFHYKKVVADGEWSRSDFFCYFGEPISSLDGKILGIIGYGELGKAVAKVAKSFGMNVLIAQSHDAGDELNIQEGRVLLSELLSRADVVSLHCPLTESNFHMIGEAEFSAMKADSMLINTARGGLVDESALLNALQDKQIAAAGLDVLEDEPPSVDHALINYTADNLIITPHIAWASRESRQNLIDAVADNISAFQQGKPQNSI